MAIETSPAHHPCDVERLRTPPGTLGASLLVAAVVVLTLAHDRVATGALASSPARVGEGRLWLLVTSGLLVQRPIVLSLLSFVGLAALTLLVCGRRVFWTSAVLGHVLSTLSVYAVLALVWLVDADVLQRLQSSPDYGVSAIAAAWIGAVALAAWTRRPSPPARAAIVLGCLGIALFSWWVKGHLNVLDSEHVVAFAIGVVTMRSTSA